jgi:hypothetical protein
MEVDAFNQLEVVAEIAAALLGFFAVFLALSKGDDGRFSESDRHFIQSIVLTASLAIVMALMPRALSLHLDGPSRWTVASAISLTLACLGIGIVAWRQLHMSNEEAALVHWGWHVGAWSLALFSLILLVLSLVFPANASAFYVSSVSILIPLGLFCFIGVIFRRFL